MKSAADAWRCSTLQYLDDEDKGSLFYAAQCNAPFHVAGHGPVKFGITATRGGSRRAARGEPPSASDRIRQLQTANPFEVVLIAAVRNYSITTGKARESAVAKHLNREHLRGEWYQWSARVHEVLELLRLEELYRRPLNDPSPWHLCQLLGVR